MEENLIEQCKRLRKELDEFTPLIRGLHNSRNLAKIPNQMYDDPGYAEHANMLDEARANIELALRHLEDCRMRLGKVIQAMDGGKSCYNQ